MAITLEVLMPAVLSNSWRAAVDRMARSLGGAAELVWEEISCVVVWGEWRMRSRLSRLSKMSSQEAPRVACSRCAILKRVRSACTFLGDKTTPSLLSGALDARLLLALLSSSPLPPALPPAVVSCKAV